MYPLDHADIFQNKLDVLAKETPVSELTNRLDAGGQGADRLPIYIESIANPICRIRFFGSS